MDLTADPLVYKENGRLYHTYHEGRYLFPCDEEEQSRLDYYQEIISRIHKIIGSPPSAHPDLHRAPLTWRNGRPQILDVGCGTGIWALNMAHAYRDADVVGMDLIRMQPDPRTCVSWPPNCRFTVPVDFEKPWVMPKDSWDLINMSMLCGSVKDWKAMFLEAFSHLKPGAGHLELVEIDLRPRCDDGTLPSDPKYPINRWYYEYLTDATKRANHPIEYQLNTMQLLEEQGFVDVNEIVTKLPINEWPEDRQMSRLGDWYHAGLMCSLDPISLAPLTRVGRWPIDHWDRFQVEIRKEFMNLNVHAYHEL